MPTVLTGFLLLAALPAAAQEEPPPERTVAATVDDRPIYAEAVEQAIERVVGEQPVTEEARAVLAGDVLERLIQRRLALAWLESSSLAASEADLDRGVSQLEGALAEQNRTLDDYFSETGLSEQELRERFAWEIGWGRFLERQMTEKNLEAYFDHHHRQFDGTELRVGQILLVPSVAAGEAGYDEALTATLAEAAALRERIAAGELTFAEAAEQFSAAPSATEGGEQGWIRRYDPMPEAFSAAAFELEAGDISPPVVTVFGVHLVHCQEVRPGDRTWQDCREELVPAIEAYLLEYVAEQQRPNSVVEVIGEVPYGGE